MDYVAIFIFVTYPRSRLNVLVSIYQDMNKTHSPYSIYRYII